MIRILQAGSSRTEQPIIEKIVRSAVRGPASEQWLISLVKLGDRWAVTLDCRERRAQRSFLCTQTALGSQIADAMAGRLENELELATAV